MTFDDFFQAIAGQESGGNYGAVNGRTGALGKYQILPSNIVPWSQQYLGKTITPNQFLNSPALQEQLARAVLSNYYNNYGARGAASAWYSGSPSNADDYRRFNANEPSIGEYVDQVLARVGKGGGSSGPAYNYLPETTTDNRVGNSTYQSTNDQPGMPKALGLHGADAAGVGLSAGTGTGLGENMGGLGTNAGTGGLQPPSEGAGTAPGATQTGGYDPTTPKHYDNAYGPVRGAVVELAQQFVGTPYKWGGTGPGGFDCSGLIQYAAQQVGVNLPRTSWDQISAGTRTSLDKLQPGDLVGFGSGGHIALWLGNGQILEAPRTGQNVRVRSIGQNEDAFGVSLANLYQ